MTRLLQIPASPRIVLLRSDSPHHLFLEAEMARHGVLDGVIVEPGQAQKLRLWEQRRFRSFYWRSYQDLRHRASGRARQAHKLFGTPTTLAASDIHETDWVNSEATKLALAKLRPEVLVVCGTSLIDDHVLRDIPVAINLHGGHLPQYRGNHGVFFAYAASDFARIGASIHLVTSDLDGGELLAIARPAMQPGMHDGELYLRAVHTATGMLCQLLTNLAAGRPVACMAQSHDATPTRHRDRTPLREFLVWWRRRTGRLRTPELPEVRWLPSHGN